MATIIDNKDFEKGAVVFCDCGGEMLQFFEETPSMTEEPYFGFIYFNSFIGKQKLKRTYFEFLDKEEIEKLCNNLLNNDYEDNVCVLTDYYTLTVVHSDDKENVVMAIVEVNSRNFKLKLKDTIEICLTKEKAKKLATTLRGWIKNNI